MQVKVWENEKCCGKRSHRQGAGTKVGPDQLIINLLSYRNTVLSQSVHVFTLGYFLNTIITFNP